MARGSAVLMFRMEGHGVNGSTSVSKTESLGSNPSAPAKPRAPERVDVWLVPGWLAVNEVCGTF